MKYLLTFKPLKHFFFGNEKTFSNSEYVAVSEYFPQNTQLLGALRLCIAEQHKLMHVHKNGKYSNEPEKLKRLIGTAGSKDFDSNADLGKINALSRMFIVKKDLSDAYFPTPYDIRISCKEESSDAEIIYYELDEISGQYFLKNHDVKKSTEQMLGNSDFWYAYINKQPSVKDGLLNFKGIKEREGAFIPHTQVGIGLEKKQTIEGAFYSKMDYQLDEKFLFASLIDMEEPMLHDGLVQIGAEGSLFEMKVHRYEDTTMDQHPIVSRLFSRGEQGNRHIALSETIVPDTGKLDVYFSVIPYPRQTAMLKSKSDIARKKAKETNYAQFQGKTQRKRVVPAGSVFFMKKDMQAEKLPLGAYEKMGYNQFITVNR